MTPMRESRLRARVLLIEAERVAREMAELIERLTAFAGELEAQLDETSDTSGGE